MYGDTSQIKQTPRRVDPIKNWPFLLEMTATQVWSIAWKLAEIRDGLAVVSALVCRHNEY